MNDSTNLELALDHFEDYNHYGPLIASYRISDHECMVTARPGHGSGRRLVMVVNLKEEVDKILDYTRSILENFSSDDLLIKSFDVLDGEIY